MRSSEDDNKWMLTAEYYETNHRPIDEACMKNVAKEDLL